MDPKANQDVLLENAVSVETNLYASYVVTKQWRLERTKIRNLLNLGVKLQTAIQHSTVSAARANGAWQEPRRCNRHYRTRG